MIHRITRTALALAHAIKALIGVVLAHIRQAWSTHVQLLRNNPAYAAAAGAGAAALAGQDNRLDLIAAIAATLLALYAATRRNINYW